MNTYLDLLASTPVNPAVLESHNCIWAPGTTRSPHLHPGHKPVLLLAYPKFPSSCIETDPSRIILGKVSFGKKIFELDQPSASDLVLSK